MNRPLASLSATDLQALITARRSIRRYRPEPVERDLIDRLIAVAGSAPSAHNRQPWRYVLLTEDGAKARLARAMGERLAADRGRDGDDADAIRRDVERSHARITGAPVVLVVCLTLEDMDRYADARRNEAEFLMAVQSTAMATQNLLLAAQAEGLGACWLCAPLFCQNTVSRAVDLPAAWRPQGLVTLGWPLEPGKARGRKSVGEILLVQDEPVDLPDEPAASDPPSPGGHNDRT